jgi:hypothetical protein
VEFFDGSTLLSTHTSAPYEHSLNFSSSAQNRGYTYTAKATDSLGGSTTSAAVNLTVNIPTTPPPPAANWFVSPTGSDSNEGNSNTAPFKTLCKAKEAATSGQTIALMPGTYDGVNQNKPPINGACVVSFAVPVTIRALDPFNTLLRGITIVMQNGGTLEGLKVANDPAQSDLGSKVSASAGSLTINGFYSQSQVGSSTIPLALSGTVQATLSPGVFVNYLGGVPDGKVLAFALVSGSAQLTVQGGRFEDETDPTNPDPSCAPLFSLNGTEARVTLDGVVVRHKGTVARITSGTFVAREGSMLEDVSTANNVGCVPAIDIEGTGNAVLEKSTLQNGVDGIASDNTGSYRGSISLKGATIKNFSKRGVFVNGNSTTAPVLNIETTGFSGNAIGLESLGRVNLKLRSSTLQNNTYGLKLGGTATSGFDLGTATDAGGNTFSGNSTSGLRLEAGLTVSATGNTWVANLQGADAAGKYAPQLKSGPDLGQNFELPTASNKVQF